MRATIHRDETDPSLLLVSLPENWEWHDFRVAILELCEILKAADEKLDIIIKLPSSPALADLRMFSQMWQLMEQCDLPVYGNHVIASPSPVVRVAVNLVRRMRSPASMNLTAATSEEEARAILALRRKRD
ncbi:MAG: hypothetical protein Kow0077_17890 [Anaerolineae bacterium]